MQARGKKRRTGARREAGPGYAFWVYGLNPVGAVLASQPENVARVLLDERVGSARAARLEEEARRRGLEVGRVAREALEEAVGRDAVHQGAAAMLREFRYASLEDVLARCRAQGPGLVLALDGVTDPQNLGALIRSAAAAGAHGVVIPKDRAAGLTPAAFKASAGTAAHLPVARVTNLARALDELREKGFWVTGADGQADKTIYTLDARGDTVLVLGAEGRGLRPGVLRRCDFAVRIPMAAGVESLNVSVAGALLLFEVVRQRRSKG